MDYGMDILVRNFMGRISRYSRLKFQAQDLNPNVQYARNFLRIFREGLTLILMQDQTLVQPYGIPRSIADAATQQRSPTKDKKIRV